MERLTDGDGLRAAWVRLEELWAQTVDRADERPAAVLTDELWLRWGSGPPAS